MISKGDIIMTYKKDWSRILDRHCFKILEQIFVEPPPDIAWIDIQNLLQRVEEEFKKDGVKAKVKPIPGDPLRVQLNGAPMGIIDEPDPAKRTAKRNIREVREILRYVGVIP
jgi:hypothetical protein